MFYTDDMLISDPNDPVNVEKHAHNRTLVSMKEELLEAVNDRREKVLGIACDIINKIQEDIVKVQKLEEQEVKEEQKEQKEGGDEFG